MVPFLSFEHTNRVIKADILLAFNEFFESSSYVLGAQTSKFENDYALFNKVAYCIGTSNGLDALYIALKALGIGAGDEVLVPSNTYVATVLAISYAGAIPVFIEPDINSYNVNPNLIESRITKATKAIMPVHLYGQACEMDKIAVVAKKYNLLIIEDNAQAHGATFNGKLTGSWGDLNATSFYPTKNLGALGDAGAITTDSEDLSKVARKLRNYGSEKKYYNEIIGFNMRLDECQAAFLSIKLKHLKNWTLERQEIANAYNVRLKDVGDLILPFVTKGASHVYHVYSIRTKRRDELQSYLAKFEIGTLIHYPVPPHLQKAYQKLGFKRGDFPIAEEIADTCLSLPVWPGMTNIEIDRVCQVCKNFFNA